MIDFQQISHHVGDTAILQDITLTIPRGALCVVLGSSGAGKSTLLRLINRLIEPSHGAILLDGQPITALAPEILRRRLGYVIQSVGLFPHWTVERNIATVPYLLGWSRSVIAERVTALLNLLALDPGKFRGRYPQQLSGGQAQRVGVARALAAKPEVLLMDEPFGALDPVTRASLQDELLRIQRVSGTTIVFVTHDLSEALRLATHLIVLDKGQVAQFGTPRDILTAPASEFVARFVGGDGAGFRRLELDRVADHYARGIIREAPPIRLDDSLYTALSLMLTDDCDVLSVVDPTGQALGSLSRSAVFASRQAP